MEQTMDGKQVVVFGATGNVGHGATEAFAAAGATVIAPTRNAEGAKQIERTFEGRGKVVPVIGDISRPESAAKLHAEILEAHEPIDHVFVALGPWWQEGSVAGQPPEAWAKVRGMLLDGHVHAAALFLPPLSRRAGTSYTVVTGMGAHEYIPNTSLLFVATNGVLALSKVIRKEHADDDVRVNELLIATRVEKRARPGVVPSAVFGKAAVAIAVGDVRGEVLRYDSPETFTLPSQ